MRFKNWIRFELTLCKHSQCQTQPELFHKQAFLRLIFLIRTGLERKRRKVLMTSVFFCLWFGELTFLSFTHFTPLHCQLGDETKWERVSYGDNRWRYSLTWQQHSKHSRHSFVFDTAFNMVQQKVCTQLNRYFLRKNPQSDRFQWFLCICRRRNLHKQFKSLAKRLVEMV